MKVYLIYSDSFKRINEEVNKIINNSLNVIKYDLKEYSLDSVIEEANYFSLMMEEKYIVVRSNELFKNSKEDNSNKIAKLLLYLDNPNPKTTIIFTTFEAPDKRKKLYKKIKEIGIVCELLPYNKKDLIYECINLLNKKGYKIDYDLGNYIVENSYVNYDIMLSEIDKISLICTKKFLTIEDIKNIVSTSINSSVFKYLKAILSNKVNNIVSIQKDLEVLKMDPTIVLISLFKEVYVLLYLKKHTVKETQIKFGKENWQMSDYISFSNYYTEEELKKIIIKLNDYDYKYKCGLLDKSIILDLLTLELC